MKKILLITFVIACLCQNIIAQNNAKIDIDLLQEMALHETSELIRINIIFEQQYDQMEMREKLSVFQKKRVQIENINLEIVICIQKDEILRF